MDGDNHQLQPMSSLSPECNELKKRYDDCFNAWFAKFLEGDQNLSVCDKYLTDYQICVQAAMKRMNIDIKEEGVQSSTTASAKGSSS